MAFYTESKTLFQLRARSLSRSYVLFLTLLRGSIQFSFIILVFKSLQFFGFFSTRSFSFCFFPSVILCWRCFYTLEDDWMRQVLQGRQHYGLRVLLVLLRVVVQNIINYYLSTVREIGYVFFLPGHVKFYLTP